MKRFMNFFAPVMAIIIGAVSCSEADVEDVVADSSTSGTVLYASTGATQTKVTFTENADNDEIDLEWEVGDVFTIYQGDELGTFKCTDAESGKFESDDVTLENGIEYTAKYNEEIESVYSQDGDQIDNLDNACQMEVTFTYGTDDVIEFKHTMAVMTFKFTSDARPSYLVFENGDKSYTVTYKTIEPVDGIYTSHIMINPCEEVERTLTFSLFDSDDKAYDIRIVTTTYAYEAGCRYTAPVSSLENSVWSGAGTEIDPYQITTAAHLRQLSTNVNAGTNYSGEYFEMANDIDLGGIDADGKGVADSEFTAIGIDSGTLCFDGTFDGDGHVVSGLYIINQTSTCQALFGNCSGAVIKNLGVSGSVTGGSMTGGIVGYGATTTISNCYYVGSVSPTHNGGGIAGRISSCSVINCYSRASVSSTGNYIGGIVGYSTNSTIEYCYNTGLVKGASNVGGILGYSYLNSNGGSDANYTVCYCWNTGSVSGSASYIGGIVGYSNSGGTTGGVLGMKNPDENGSDTLTATMKGGSFSSTLGTDNWKEDYTTQINDGYPISTWQ